MKQINLGDKVKDLVTGFEGIAVARTQWLNGCFRITLQSATTDKDGKAGPQETFDEPQLEVTIPGAVRTGPRDTGGPAATPAQHQGPQR